MTTLHVSQDHGRHLRRQRRGKRTHFLLPLMGFSAVALTAFGYIGYVLWPRWPAPRVDAPALPITVAGVAFNLPPAAIRVPVQRRPGAQERVDLAFLWPSLEPPDPNAKPAVPAPATARVPSQAFVRVFMTIAAAGDTLAPAERLLTIYPRYTAGGPAPGPEGLTVLAFRDGTPYQGEDLIRDAGASGFLARCTRSRAGPTPAICLYERRIDAADVVVRFPREVLLIHCLQHHDDCSLRHLLAQRLAHGRRQPRSADRRIAATALRPLIRFDPIRCGYPLSSPGSSKSSARIGSSK